MLSKIADKSVKIIIVENNSAIRALIIKSLRGFGFENIESQPNIKDLLGYLETEAADWLLIPALLSGEVNALQILKLASQIKGLKDTRISVFIEESDEFIIPYAFEMGAISFHQKVSTKESFEAEIKEFIEITTKYDNDEVFVSAHYLREYLIAKEEYSSALSLDRSLLKQYPGNLDILFNMIFPMVKEGKKDEAKNILNQIIYIEPSFADKVEEMEKKYLDGESAFDDDFKGENVFNLKNVVIVEPDEGYKKELESLFTSIGFQNYHSFADGAAAWEYIDSLTEEPDMILQEWNLAKLTGPNLLQRVRAKGFWRTYVFILSNTLSEEDTNLLTEMGGFFHSKKPLDKSEFFKKLIMVVTSDINSDLIQQEIKILNLFKGGSIEDGIFLAGKFLKIDGVSKSSKLVVKIALNYAQENYLEAKQLALESLRKGDNSVTVLNYFGKICIKIGEFQTAVKVFSKANSYSPDNVDRMCSLAEAQADLGDTSNAMKSIEAAKIKDKDSKTVKDGEVKVAISAGKTALALSLMEDLESISGLISYMNNKGVALAKCDELEASIEVYKKTLASIPKKSRELKSITNYNLALAYIKNSDADAALSVLKKEKRKFNNKVTDKIRALKQRLMIANSEGKVVELNFAAAIESVQELDIDENQVDTLNDLKALVDLKVGDLCCFQLYRYVETMPNEVKKLLEKPITFTYRAAIKTG